MATQGRRRALGQHFLRDQDLAQQIAQRSVEEAARHGCSHLLEIGPGKGALTLPALAVLRQFPQVQKFTLVERDPALASHWKSEAKNKALFSEGFQFGAVAGDFLEVQDPEWLNSTPLAVMSNLPYSAGTAILNRLALHRREIPIMVLMFQAEVAQRLRAEPSTPDRGSLSLWIQNQWDVEKLMTVPPRAFMPPPQVNSEVVVLTRRETPQIPGSWEGEGAVQWQALLKICFSQRRKMLRSLLHSRQPWQNALELSGVDGTKRAEALRWQEWDQLFQAVQKVNGSRPTL